MRPAAGAAGRVVRVLTGIGVVAEEGVGAEELFGQHQAGDGCGRRSAGIMTFGGTRICGVGGGGRRGRLLRKPGSCRRPIFRTTLSQTTRCLAIRRSASSRINSPPDGTRDSIARASFSGEGCGRMGIVSARNKTVLRKYSASAFSNHDGVRRVVATQSRGTFRTTPFTFRSTSPTPGTTPFPIPERSPSPVPTPFAIPERSPSPVPTPFPIRERTPGPIPGGVRIPTTLPSCIARGLRTASHARPPSPRQSATIRARPFPPPGGARRFLLTRARPGA